MLKLHYGLVGDVVEETHLLIVVAHGQDLATWRPAGGLDSQRAAFLRMKFVYALTEQVVD